MVGCYEWCLQASITCWCVFRILGGAYRVSGAWSPGTLPPNLPGYERAELQHPPRRVHRSGGTADWNSAVVSSAAAVQKQRRKKQEPVWYLVVRARTHATPASWRFTMRVTSCVYTPPIPV